MGCDIHMYTERRVNGKWVHADPSVRSFSESNESRINIHVPYQHQIYKGRNYLLFGVLAGVRTSECQKFEPKGFPEDASLIVREMYDQYGSDAHTPSYLTLKELESIDWNKECVPQTYNVTERQLKELEFVLRVYEGESKGGFKSKVKCGQYDKEMYNANVYDIYNIIKTPWTSRVSAHYFPEYGKKYGKASREKLVEIEAATPIEYILEGFNRNVIFKLETWEPHTDPENIRIVFWFDN